MAASTSRLVAAKSNGMKSKPACRSGTTPAQSNDRPVRNSEVRKLEHRPNRGEKQPTCHWLALEMHSGDGCRNCFRAKTVRRQVQVARLEPCERTKSCRFRSPARVHRTATTNHIKCTDSLLHHHADPSRLCAQNAREKGCTEETKQCARAVSAPSTNHTPSPLL